jgi:hypothetical protein
MNRRFDVPITIWTREGRSIVEATAKALATLDEAAPASMTKSHRGA